MAIVYISCPISVNQNILDNCIQLVEKTIKDVSTSGTVGYWAKGSPYDSDTFNNYVDFCDAFVIILPSLSWKCHYNTMSAGIRKEYTRAVNKGKKIFLYYVPLNNVPNIYSTKIYNDRHIEGVSGTAHQFKELVQHIATNKGTLLDDKTTTESIVYKSNEELLVTKVSTIDMRLLLSS